jgi:predicted nuclease with TOPRIM domain
MSDIPQLEQRIARALERIRAGLDVLPGPETAERAQTLAARVAELEAARAADQDARSALEEQLRELRDGLARAEAEKSEMMDAMQKLQTVNADLRLAAAEGVTDPDVINRALVADLEALQAARAADLRDIDAILSELAPMRQEA